MDSKKDEGKELLEKDYLSNGFHKNPFLLWVFLAVFILVLVILWAMGSWQDRYLTERKRDDPFLRVTNRQFSLFLWQNPEFMRVNAKSKTGYLPGFRSEDNVHLIPQEAEEFVSAPPEVIFRYHVWRRLIGNWVADRIILGKEFSEFLQDCPEWKPEIWSRNQITTGEFDTPPKGYADFISRLPTMSEVNLATMPFDSFPLDARLAFQGWRNYFKEGESVNQYRPDFKEMDLFLKNYPNYQRSLWRNILNETQPQYLVSYLKPIGNESEKVPNNELSPFLRVGIFNFQKAQEDQSTTTNPSG